ncbi:MAG: efflux RND transporter permease subunit [Saprospiraceae bacterium]|uniref:Efflux RND transporter permease subunit n=1 Tax=Candidatus Defluviibacterium haderslevense TaxID=2981993 RepID=A0A9D7S7J6_9BACT|nr:efflux RND transporter permease subunit [Candidatus Defluviibacterium haderslevense]MBK9716663.1 efflux RND transporter permease subunit [Candidatus Defluviibacterium haderslevense]MBL0235896.1 efflux RND transporter permease subunit [Candidatus Defluviibacterium haderslevense]
MNISHFSLRRPVFAVVMNIVIVLFGIIGFRFLGVRDFPAIDPPTVSIKTNYPGANADIIESQISEPLEKAINGIAGIKNITSLSSQGSSSINVEFELNEDMESAANDVRDKVAQAIRNLPSDLDAPPVVSKADASSESILSMTVKSDTKNQLELTEFANNNLLEKLQTIPGVSSIMIWGEKKYAMRIWMDPVKLNAFGLTVQDIQEALIKENIEMPAGKISGNTSELSVRTFGRLQTEEDFNQLIIKNLGGSEIRIKDIGEAVLGPENEETVLKESGVPMIGMALSPQPGANYVAISDEFYKRYEQIKKDLPKEFEINIALDQAKFIKQSILEVKETLIISIILVILIVFLFFRDWLIAIRPLIDIPVSLIGSFFIMYLCGFTINVLTLLAIVLATGLVVDDGIVVTENIFKKMEAGMGKYKAAREGSQEIYFAVISTSITLAVVFLPIIFLEGFVGRLFREFGIVVAGAVLISAFVSLTLTPILNVKFSRKVFSHSWFYRKTEPFYIWLEESYHGSLRFFLRTKILAWVVLLVCFGSIYYFGKNLKSELAPLEDRSQFRLSLTAPEGSSYEYMDQYIDKLSQFLLESVPEKNIILSVTAPSFIGSGAVNTGFIRVVLCDPNKRQRSQDQIVQVVSKSLSKFPEGKAFPIQEQTISVNRRGGLPVQFVIQHVDFNKIKEILPKFIEEANKNPVFQQVDVDLKFNKPELHVEIDRPKAASLGVSIEEIGQTIQLAYSNRRVGYFTKDGKQYQVIGQIEKNERDEPADLKLLYVKSKSGQLIALDNLVTLNEATSTPTIYHFNRYKSATISAGLASGKSLGEGIKAMEDIGKKLLDPSFSTALSGPSRDFKESSSNVGFAFILALILIFLILAAQFESFSDPIIIMITVPLAMAGALFSLWFFDLTINIFSQIGMIMLIGLVTKNGILIVDFANKKRMLGIEKNVAILEAATQRMRPILMTSLAMALGALPLALSFGAASASRVPLGVVIIGGIIFALLLTLFIVPAMYLFLSSKKDPINEDL